MGGNDRPPANRTARRRSTAPSALHIGRPVKQEDPCNLGVNRLEGRQSTKKSGTSSAVVTPAWLVIGSLVFATFIGLLSGLYPALRAATLVPVIALKTE